jgi:hypothetical protein
VQCSAPAEHQALHAVTPEVVAQKSSVRAWALPRLLTDRSHEALKTEPFLWADGTSDQPTSMLAASGNLALRTPKQFAFATSQETLRSYLTHVIHAVRKLNGQVGRPQTPPAPPPSPAQICPLGANLLLGGPCSFEFLCPCSSGNIRTCAPSPHELFYSNHNHCLVLMNDKH